MRLRIDFVKDSAVESGVFEVEDDFELPPGPFGREWLGSLVGSDDGDIIGVEQEDT